MRKVSILIALMLLIGLSADAGIVRLPSIAEANMSLIVAGGGTPAEEAPSCTKTSVLTFDFTAGADNDRWGTLTEWSDDTAYAKIDNGGYFGGTNPFTGDTTLFGSFDGGGTGQNVEAQPTATTTGTLVYVTDIYFGGDPTPTSDAIFLEFGNGSITIGTIYINSDGTLTWMDNVTERTIASPSSSKHYVLAVEIDTDPISTGQNCATIYWGEAGSVSAVNAADPYDMAAQADQDEITRLKIHRIEADIYVGYTNMELYTSSTGYCDDH